MPVTAADLNVGLEALADRTAYLKAQVEAVETDTAATLQKVAMRAWDNSILPITAGGRSVLIDFLVAPKAQTTPTLNQRAVLAVGHDTSDSNHLAWIRSFGAGFFESAFHENNDQGPLCAASGNEGDFLSGVTGGFLRYADLAVSGPTTYTTSFDPTALAFVESGAAYISANKDNGTFDHGTNPASLTASAAVATSFQAANLGVAGGEFAFDAAGHVVFCASSVVAAVTRFRMFNSTDYGATWAVAQTFGAGITWASVVWVPESSVFFAMASDGAFYTSPTGATWTAISSVGATYGGYGKARHGTMAASAGVIAKAVTNNLASGIDAHGVIYTTDLGATWSIYYFADRDGLSGVNFGIRSLIGANGRFYATDGESVFRSGVMDPGTPEIST